MLKTELNINETLRKYLIDKQISYELMGCMSWFKLDKLGNDNVKNAERCSPDINAIFVELVPVGWPVDMSYELFLKTYHLLSADTAITPDSMDVYVMYKCMLYTKERCGNDSLFFDIGVWSDLKDMIDELNLEGIDQDKYENEIMDFFETIFECDNFLKKIFGSFDCDVYDVMSNNEIEKLLNGFVREYIPKENIYMKIAEENSKMLSCKDINPIDPSDNLEDGNE